SDLKKLKTNLKLEAHLMVEKPEDVIDNWIKSGVKRIIIHYEATKKLSEVIKKIQDAGLEASIAINPETSANELSPFLNVSSILSVLIMTVRPGRGGQEFIEATLGKIRALRERDENVKIEVDGGINLETAQKVVRAGADILAVGSAIFKSEDIKKSIEELEFKK
ncbi:ribulose-phosphate 3-epimerase, partial [Patescibacteria group bacterium]|nr:ribulose-phosphate 3-epimerase [Patescibacteria group bacterium]